MAVAIQLAGVLLIGYLIGTLNWAYLVMRLWGKADLRRLGTGNLGARNVKRHLGLGAAILVYLGDAIKGALPVWVMQQLAWHPQADLVIALGVILGHNYSIWLGWKGGKGLSSASAILLVLSWQLFLLVVTAGLLGLLLTRNLYLAAVLMAVVFPPILWRLRPDGMALSLAVLMSLAVISRHWRNLAEMWGDSP